MTNATATPTKPSVTQPTQPKLAPPAVPLWAKAVRLTLWTPVALVAAVLATEALFAAAHIGEEEFVDIHKTIGFWHMPHKFVTWRAEGYSQGTTSDDGLRDVNFTVQKPAGVTRVAMVGDSMTEGYQVESDRTFGKLLQSKLAKQDDIKAEVMNFGMSGMSTAQDLYLYKEKIAKYHPDVVILAYHIGDNEKNIYAPGADSFMPRPYCMLDENKLLKTDWHGYDVWMNGPKHKEYDETYWLRANSRVWGVLTKCDLQLSEKAWYAKAKKSITSLFKPAKASDWKGPHRVVSTDDEFDLPPQPHDTKYATTANTNFQYYPVPTNLSKKQATELAQNRQAIMSWRAILLDSKNRFGTTGAIIETLNRACAANGCKLIVAGLPAPNNSMLYFRELKMMSELAKQAGFTFVDVNAAFPSLPPMKECDLYYNVHFTPKGHDVVANTIYTDLKRVISESPRLPLENHK